MNSPQIVRPQFPPGYVENAKSLLPWSHVEQRLADALHYLAWHWCGPTAALHAIPPAGRCGWTASSTSTAARKHATHATSPPTRPWWFTWRTARTR